MLWEKNRNKLQQTFHEANQKLALYTPVTLKGLCPVFTWASLTNRLTFDPTSFRYRPARRWRLPPRWPRVSRNRYTCAPCEPDVFERRWDFKSCHVLLPWGSRIIYKTNRKKKQKSAIFGQKDDSFQNHQPEGGIYIWWHDTQAARTQIFNIRACRNQSCKSWERSTWYWLPWTCFSAKKNCKIFDDILKWYCPSIPWTVRQKWIEIKSRNLLGHQRFHFLLVVLQRLHPPILRAPATWITDVDMDKHWGIVLLFAHRIIHFPERVTDLYKTLKEKGTWKGERAVERSRL